MTDPVLDDDRTAGQRLLAEIRARSEGDTTETEEQTDADA